LPIESPADSSKKNGGLKKVLKDHPCVIVSDPTVLHGFGKWDAYSSGKDENNVTESKRNRILGEHGRKLKVQRPTTGFYTSYICLHGEYEDRYPEQ